jgi:malonyl-CoA decarboxylase
MEELKWRTTGNRKAFAFCHPSISKEPVAFIMVALMDHIPISICDIQDGYVPSLSDDGKPFLPTYAIFYSISSTQKGEMSCAHVFYFLNA